MNWFAYLLTSVIFSLLLIEISNFMHYKNVQKTVPSAYIPIGSGPLKTRIHESHRIERVQRRNMQKAIGWEGFDPAVEAEYLRNKYGK